MIDYLKKIQQHTALNENEAYHAVQEIMNGDATEAQIGAFLMGLSVRGETAAEIAGAALVMRDRALTILAPEDAVDCCGTGGDFAGTYNISTAVALVAASCGAPVAKHGNRAASSKSGTADVLEALGVNLDLDVDALEDALERFHFCFLMAPRHHDAMKRVAPVRKQLGTRTLFNLLGPLANPAGTKRQLIGVFDRKWLAPMAEALKILGAGRAWIVHGADGLDEITLTGETNVARLEDGQITEQVLTPTDFGLPTCKPEDLKGGAPEDNAAALRAILEGERNAYRDIVLANAAAVLVIHQTAQDLTQAVKIASEAIDSGRTLELLEKYAQFTNSQRP